MLLLISDANILMDVEVGELVAPMFSLGYQFAVPDILYYEELEDQHAHLQDMGLQIRKLSSEVVKRVQTLSQTYAKPGRNDLFALALAEAEKCPLLTGDAALRQAAEAEHLEVKGTIWLISEMVGQQRITVHVARAALQKMRVSGRRLPWDIAEQVLCEIEAALPGTGGAHL
jgi:predicted nucleic acid-binding protein